MATWEPRALGYSTAVGEIDSGSRTPQSTSFRTSPHLRRLSDRQRTSRHRMGVGVGPLARFLVAERSRCAAQGLARSVGAPRKPKESRSRAVVDTAAPEQRWPLLPSWTECPVRTPPRTFAHVTHLAPSKCPGSADSSPDSRNSERPHLRERVRGGCRKSMRARISFGEARFQPRSISATRNASSNDCWVFNRGSHAVS